MPEEIKGYYYKLVKEWYEMIEKGISENDAYFVLKYTTPDWNSQDFFWALCN